MTATFPILADRFDYTDKRYLAWTLKPRMKFLLGWCKPAPTPILDIGGKNELSRVFGERTGIEIVNTCGDLDSLNWHPQKPEPRYYSDVLCFEVLEHLANPLQFLITLREKMKPGGRLWLTTPKASWRCWWNRDHFIEYDRKRLNALLERAGFEVVELGLTKSGWPLRTFWRGIRPFVRALIRWNFYVRALA